VFSLNLIPLGGFVRLKGEASPEGGSDSYYERPAMQRMMVLLAGPMANLLLAPLLFTASTMVSDIAGYEVVFIEPDGPAAHSGVLPGDVIKAVDGSPVGRAGDPGGIIGISNKDLVTFTVDRGSQILQIPVAPRANPPDGQGPIGVRLHPSFSPTPVDVAVQRGVVYTIRSLIVIPRHVIDVLGGAELEVSGPVGIVNVFGEATRYGPEFVLFLAGLISAQLALFNLLPWPVLDGGRITLIIVEILRRRRLSRSQEAAINFTGMALLIMLVLMVTMRDVQQLIN
tara:strand:- start:2008 stop:2859 length:852 start_codon:yes stop_codon:yes gene_type:complete